MTYAGLNQPTGTPPPESATAGFENLEDDLNYEKTRINGFEFPEAETAPKIQIHQHADSNLAPDLDDLDPYTVALKYMNRTIDATAAQFDGSSNVEYYRERAQVLTGYRFA